MLSLASVCPLLLVSHAEASKRDWPLAVIQGAAATLPADSTFGDAVRRFELGCVDATSCAPGARKVEVKLFQDWAEHGLSCVVWGASIALSSYVSTLTLDWASTRVLELGAGCGLAGLAAAGSFPYNSAPYNSA